LGLALIGQAGKKHSVQGTTASAFSVVDPKYVREYIYIYIYIYIYALSMEHINIILVFYGGH